jgi:hypothetical protein
MASPEDQRRVADELRRRLRELMKRLPAAVGDPKATTRAAHPSAEIHPDVLKISGLVPPDVDARVEYRDYMIQKHR